MPFTKTFAVTAAQTDIVVGSYTKKVTLREDGAVAGCPTTDFILRCPNGSNLPVRRLTGTSHDFEGNFHPGQVLGTIAVVVATTFQQIEE